MSASERLAGLKPEGLVVTTGTNEGYTDAVCLPIPVHAAVVAVVEAAEVQPWAFVANDGDGREAVAVDLADWRKVQAALRALEEALQ